MSEKCTWRLDKTPRCTETDADEARVSVTTLSQGPSISFLWKPDLSRALRTVLAFKCNTVFHGLLSNKLSLNVTFIAVSLFLLGSFQQNQFWLVCQVEHKLVENTRKLITHTIPNERIPCFH